jgi:hypothetical protein
VVLRKTTKNKENLRNQENPSTKQKEKKDSQATQDPLLTYHGKEPNVRKVLARAYKETPGAKNDIEAVFGHIANVDEINRQQQQQIIELAKKLIQAQKNYNQQEQRFQELTDKLRQQGNQPTAQDVQAAQIAGQIERKPQAVAENTPRMTAREKLQQAVDREKKQAQDDRTGLSGLDYDDLQRQLRGILDRTRPKKVDEDSDNPAVEQAIARRIMVGRTDLLLKYGPKKVMQAVEQVADYVGSVDEIGSSDVSGWVGQVEQALGSPDNAVMGADGSAILFKHFQAYGQFFLDEFTFELIKINPRVWTNKFGIQAGLKYINVLGIPNLDAQVELNVVRPYTYSHRDSLSNYTHYNQSLAHPTGANFKEICGKISYQPRHRLTVNYSFAAQIVGLDTLGSDWGSNPLISYNKRPSRLLQGDKDYTFQYHIGDGVRTTIFVSDLVVSYQFAHNMYVDFNYIHRSQLAAVSTLNRLEDYYAVGVRINFARNTFLF